MRSKFFIFSLVVVVGLIGCGKKEEEEMVAPVNVEQQQVNTVVPVIENNAPSGVETLSGPNVQVTGGQNVNVPETSPIPPAAPQPVVTPPATPMPDGQQVLPEQVPVKPAEGMQNQAQPITEASPMVEQPKTSPSSAIQTQTQVPVPTPPPVLQSAPAAKGSAGQVELPQSQNISNVGRSPTPFPKDSNIMAPAPGSDQNSMSNGQDDDMRINDDF